MKKNKIQHLNHQFCRRFQGRTLTGMPGCKPSRARRQAKGPTLTVKNLKIMPVMAIFSYSKTLPGLSDQPKTIVDPLWHSLNQIANLPQIL